MKKLLLIGFTAGALFLGGCAVEAVDTTPGDVAVVQGEPPYAGAVWIGTEWNWSGGRYVAVPAHWERPHGTWQAGHWNHTNKGYRWARGRWHK